MYRFRNSFGLAIACFCVGLIFSESAQAATEITEEEIRIILKEAYPKSFSKLAIKFNAKEQRWDFYCNRIHKECGSYGFSGSVFGSKLKPQLFYVPGEG